MCIDKNAATYMNAYACLATHQLCIHASLKKQSCYQLKINCKKPQKLTPTVFGPNKVFLK